MAIGTAIGWRELAGDDSGLAWVVVAALASATLYFLFRRPRRTDDTPIARSSPADAPLQVQTSSPPPPARASAAPASLPPKAGGLALIGGQDDSEFDPTIIATRARLFPSHPVVPKRIDVGVAAPQGAKLKVDAASRMSRGVKRQRHEDAFTMLRNVYALADGVGGYEGGGEASRTAVQAFEKVIATGPYPHVEFAVAVPDGARQLVASIVHAHSAVLARAGAEKDLAQMATTMLALRVDPEEGAFYLANVGDSRCYRLRDGVLTQLSTDHTTTEKGVSALSRALGAAPTVQVDLTIGGLLPGDLFLLCTDGLYREVEDLQSLLVNHVDLFDCGSKLVAAAEAHGGSDNISIVLVRVSS